MLNFIPPFHAGTEWGNFLCPFGLSGTFFIRKGPPLRLRTGMDKNS